MSSFGPVIDVGAAYDGVGQGGTVMGSSEDKRRGRTKEAEVAGGGLLVVNVEGGRGIGIGEWVSRVAESGEGGGGKNIDWSDRRDGVGLGRRVRQHLERWSDLQGCWRAAGGLRRIGAVAERAQEHDRDRGAAASGRAEEDGAVA